jgi:membrane protein DedA with SNARE-associated domain
MPDVWSIVNQFPYPSLFLLLVFGSIGFPFPEDAVLVLCGILISQRVVSPLPAVLTVYAGLLFSDWIVFSLSKKYGHGIFRHKLFSRVISPERIASLEQQLRRYGPFLLLSCRYIPVLRTQIFIASGLLGMASRTFLITDMVAALVSVGLTVTTGYSGARWISKAGMKALPVGFMVLILAAVLILMVTRGKRRNNNVMVSSNSRNRSPIE